MKTKTANNKVSKESISRKSKKLERKEIYHGKEKVEEKKQRRPIQKNRFTNIEELPNPTKNMPLELFGSLVFNFANETSDVQISDSTGDYELRVSTETLTEFKLKVLLGVDQRSKPKFTILLGDCQCYPELPEGTLVMRQAIDKGDAERGNENVEMQLGAITPGKTYSIEGEIMDGVSDFSENRKTNPEQDTADILRETMKREDELGRRCKEKCKAEIECSDHLSKHGDVSCTDDELTRLSKKSGRGKNSQRLSKKDSKKGSKKTRSSKIQDSASTYLSNLEGLIKFLINDEICSSALKAIKAPRNVKNAPRRIVSGRNMIRYSDGREFVITFEEKDGTEPRKAMSADKIGSSECPPNSIKSESDTSLTTLKELLSASDDKTGKKLDEEFRAREQLMNAVEFVEDVRKELIEWQMKCEEADVTIIESEKTNPPEERLEVKVSSKTPDKVNSLQKIEEVYEDAASYNSNVAQADSLEHFFIELDKYDKISVSKESKTTTNQLNSNSEATPSGTIDSKPNSNSKTSNGMNFSLDYSPPIPLNMTSASDIELMWSSFIKQFYSSKEVLKTPTSNVADGIARQRQNTDLHIEQYRQRVSGFECSSKLNDLALQSKLDGNIYPGQHCFPYFVEANLKRVNSVMSSYKVTASHKSVVNQSDHDFGKPHPTFHSNGQPKYNLPTGIHILNPNKMNSLREWSAFHPLQRTTNTHSQERYTSRRHRIFFNPNVSAGDWY